MSLELQLKADLTLENCIDRVRNSEMVKKQNEVVKGVGEVDFTRALSQRVTEDVQTVTYFLTIATQKDEVCNNCGKKGHYARCCRSDGSTRGSGRGSNRGSGRGSGRSRGRGNY